VGRQVCDPRSFQIVWLPRFTNGCRSTAEDGPVSVQQSGRFLGGHLRARPLDWHDRFNGRQWEDGATLKCERDSED